MDERVSEHGDRSLSRARLDAVCFAPEETVRGARGGLLRAAEMALARSGMTLTELLVVIVVMVLLLALSVPLMRSGLEERKLREAARQLNTYIALARARAAETHRPVGLWIDVKTLPESNTSVAGHVFLAEVQAPYVGDIVGAKAAVTIVSPTLAKVKFDPADSASFWSLANENDFVRFDYKGPLYRIVKKPSLLGGSPYVDIDLTGLPPPWPNPYPPPWPPPAPAGYTPLLPLPPTPSGGLLYEVFRQPAKSSGAPLEFPADVIVDLAASGYGLGDTSLSAATTPVVILFNPDGSVSYVVSSSLQPKVPSEAIHLLLGKVEQAGNANLQDSRNLWVSINPRNGQVTTVENVGGVNVTVAAAREFTRSAQAMGGR